jgi:hypothetical protein
LGGLAALSVLLPCLPATNLARSALGAAKAIFAVLRSAPEQPGIEHDVTEVLAALLSRCGAKLNASQLQLPESMMKLSSNTRSIQLQQPSGTPVDVEGLGQGDGHSVLDEQFTLQKPLMEFFVQQLLSSRSTSAARSAALSGLQACPMLPYAAWSTKGCAHWMCVSFAGNRWCTKVFIV